MTQLAPGLWRIAVAYPFGSTGQASNVYVLGLDEVLLIDAGSADPDGTVARGLDAIGGPSVSDIFLTHTHQDHAGGVVDIANATGATVWIPMGEPEESVAVIAREIATYQILEPGKVIRQRQATLQVVATPGHAPGHVAFFDKSRRWLFAGDLISGNGTIAVVPPRGSMSEYIESLFRVRDLDIATVFPGHGPEVTNGMEIVEDYLRRRISRENEILGLIKDGVDTLDLLTDHVYGGVTPQLQRAARGTMLAHLLKLLEDSRLAASSSDIERASFTVDHQESN